MTSAAVLHPAGVPGLHTAPTLDDLERSRQVYNSLPDDGDQPEVTSAVLDSLKKALLKHGVQDKFGYHLIHGHLTVMEGRVMFGKSMAKLQGCYSRPTDISQLPTADMHGHIFALDKGAQFVAYEYRQGPPPHMDANDNAFLDEVRGMLLREGLEKLIGVQVLTGEKGKELQEFVLSDDYGAVMLDADSTNVNGSYRVTGWSAVRAPGGIVELKGNESHAKTVRETHQVFTDGKGLPDIDEEVVIDALREAGVIG